MATADPNTVWAAAMVIMAGVAFLLGANSAERFRKGCTECAAVQRRLAEKQRELSHDYEHKGPGFAPTSPDRYDCNDENCNRNTRKNGLDKP